MSVHKSVLVREVIPILTGLTVCRGVESSRVLPFTSFAVFGFVVVSFVGLVGVGHLPLTIPS